ncbi:hypothetical protein BJF81_08545 [Ornithinimicrobium sp. CNJ-824]|nr:hypothetical protein BJF81_08545 [Ornithinimicrobium sp. CNJ-824]
MSETTCQPRSRPISSRAVIHIPAWLSPLRATRTSPSGSPARQTPADVPLMSVLHPSGSSTG